MATSATLRDGDQSSISHSTAQPEACPALSLSNAVTRKDVPIQALDTNKHETKLLTGAVGTLAALASRNTRGRKKRSIAPVRFFC